MTLIVCLDDNLGMAFNHRRQSRDSAVLEDILARTGAGRLWLEPYSAALFPPGPQILAAEDFLTRAGAGDFCFVERVDPAPWADRAEGLILYRWNRRYPADVWLTLPLDGWRLTETLVLAGTSHDKLTREVYIK